MDDRPGFEDDYLDDIISKIPVNLVTGRSELPDVMRYMSRNPSTMEEFAARFEAIDAAKPHINLSTYNFSALSSTIVHESFWTLEKDGDTLFCCDNQGIFRMVEDLESGSPESSEKVLLALKHAIASPLIPLEPCLPWFLLISIKLKRHVPTLSLFLNTLPRPFHWRLETSHEAKAVDDGVKKANQIGVRVGLQRAEELKTVGNVAFGSKRRQPAIEAYSGAIDHLVDVLAQKPDVEDIQRANRLLAMCFGNRSASYLLPGDGIDAEKALQDGKSSEGADPTYAKSYARQASALVILGDTSGALDALARALHRRDLENDVGLVERFIEVLTDGKGIPNDEEEFKNWISDILVNDGQSSERLKDIQGLWKAKLDAQFASYNRGNR